MDKEVPRSAFAQDLLYSLGPKTVSRVARNQAEYRVSAVLAGKNDPFLSPRSGSKASTSMAEAAEDDTIETVDLTEVASDAIRARIGATFKGHKLAVLVGALLETQQYRAVVSPAGADGGVDIVAGKGPLRFDPPRLVVQVKSQDSPVDVSVLRELHGVM